MYLFLIKKCMKSHSKLKKVSKTILKKEKSHKGYKSGKGLREGIYLNDNKNFNLDKMEIRMYLCRKKRRKKDKTG